jgi:hypothetical protein
MCMGITISRYAMRRTTPPPATIELAATARIVLRPARPHTITVLTQPMA